MRLQNGIEIKTDAVFLQPGSGLPTAKITTRELSENEVENIAAYLFNGREMYRPWEASKAEIESDIIYYKNIIYDSSSSEDDIRWAESNLRQKQIEYQNAPETTEKTLAEISFTQKNSADIHQSVSGELSETQTPSFDYDEIEIWAEKGEDSRSVLNIININNGENSWLMYTDDVKPNFRGYVPFELPLSDDTDIGITYDEALDTANELISSSGIDLKLSDSTLLFYKQMSSDPNMLTTDKIKDTDMKAYKFYYTRHIDDAAITYDNNISLGELNNDYSNPVYYEVASVIVDKNGIRSMEYRAPYKIVEILQKDTEIIDINEALERLKKHLEFTYSADSNISEDIDSITIDRIALGLSRIRTSQGEYLLVPTYDFFGNITKKDRNGISVAEISPCNSVCTVNAVDGSIINKSSGY